MDNEIHKIKTVLYSDLINYYKEQLDICLFWNRVSHSWGIYNKDHKIFGRFANERRCQIAQKIRYLRKMIRMAKELKQEVEKTFIEPYLQGKTL